MKPIIKSLIGSPEIIEIFETIISAQIESRIQRVVAAVKEELAGVKGGRVGAGGGGD